MAKPGVVSSFGRDTVELVPTPKTFEAKVHGTTKGSCGKAIKELLVEAEADGGCSN